MNSRLIEASVDLTPDFNCIAFSFLSSLNDGRGHREFMAFTKTVFEETAVFLHDGSLILLSLFLDVLIIVLCECFL